MVEPKTVAILGGRAGRPRRRRPCAGARHGAGRARSRARGGACRAPVGPCPHVLAVGIQHRQGGRAPARGDRLELARSAGDYPTGGELVERYLEPLATRTPLKDHIRTSSRVTAVGRAGFDKMKNNGRDVGALHHPLPERQGPRAAQGRRGDRCHRHLVLAQSGRRRRPAGDSARRASRRRSPTACPMCCGRDRARYAGKTVAVLGAGHSAIGTLIELARLKDEVPATEIVWLLRGDSAGEGVRRRRQRQALRARRAGRGFRRACRQRQVQGRGGLPRLAYRPRRRGAARRRPARAAAAGRVTVDELVVATGFRPAARLPARDPARARSRASSARRAGAADRSQPA